MLSSVGRLQDLEAETVLKCVLKLKITAKLKNVIDAEPKGYLLQ